MSMSADQENFERLRQLLALKRHEQPPPGYFNNFSREVIARIRAGEAGFGASAGEPLFSEPSLLQRFWSLFETKPALAGAFGVLVCGLLVSGVIYSGGVDQQAVPAGAINDMFAGTAKPVANAALQRPVLVSSTNGILQPGGSLFEEFQARQPQAQPVNYFNGN